MFKRGAVVVASDPTEIRWRGQHVPLSPIEADLFAYVARRGRVLFSEMDEALTAMGASAGTRKIVIGHIRRKFLNLGACDPFERLGASGVRLRVDVDEAGRSDAVIGLRMPRFARATD